MCDVKKYNDIFKEIKKLTQEDTTQLILEASTEEDIERRYFESLKNLKDVLR